jgi:hypothetical protein
LHQAAGIEGVATSQTTLPGFIGIQAVLNESVAGMGFIALVILILALLIILLKKSKQAGEQD